MRCIFAALLGAIGAAFIEASDVVQPATSVYSWAFGKSYDSLITAEMLARTPGWPTSSENPPIGGRKAIKLAQRMRDALTKHINGLEWKLLALHLQPIEDRWVWIVRYQAVPRIEAETPHVLQLVVLMDGSVVKPDVHESPVPPAVQYDPEPAGTE